jgi:hypothetical protein
MITETMILHIVTHEYKKCIHCGMDIMDINLKGDGYIFDGHMLNPKILEKYIPCTMIKTAPDILQQIYG